MRLNNFFVFSRVFRVSVFVSLSFLMLSSLAAQKITLVLSAKASPREQYGAQKLQEALKRNGFSTTVVKQDKATAQANRIYIGLLQQPFIQQAVSQNGFSLTGKPGKEGFSLAVKAAKKIAVVAGADASGAMYGCLELAEKINQQHEFAALNMTDQPEMVLRGACIGVQKPYYLPGRTVYEYPYTPETFPWLYDKKLWIQYLDSLASNRMNSLYLWNGHPFASLVKLKDYPYAVEVDDSTFKKNEELYSFLTKEADKRGIWVIQMFYNIIVSKPFAEKNGLKTQERERHILPIISDYTRKSIAAFVAKYPNVGLLITLGEAMEGVGQDDIDWFTKTIIPGVQDGMKMLGRKDEPPIVLRAHDTDAPSVMKAAMPLYKNLYTMAKYNGEALTTYTPRGKWADLHRTLSRIGTVQIENVHILANLEPFRYASADFIQKCVQAMHSVYEANGLHLYPEASYWDWPYSADKTAPRLLEMERDWLWYKQWARYAWKSNYDRANEIGYWSGSIANWLQTTPANGQKILEAFEETGEIAPKLLRRFGITDGNRQTLTLGMQMTQLINPFRYGLFTLLYESEAPEGESLIEFAAKDWKGEQHIGETPLVVINDVKQHAAKARAAIEAAASSKAISNEEFKRIYNDILCYEQLAINYAEKATAALHVLRYKYSKDIKDLDKALPHLKASVLAYAKLAELTRGTYLYANSMQTAQRKIPFRGVDGTMKTWEEILPLYQKELGIFERKLDSLKQSTGKLGTQAIQPLGNAVVEVAAGGKGAYELKPGAVIFSDSLQYRIDTLSPELLGLKAVLLSKSGQGQEGTVIRFKTQKPVKLLVGYFNKPVAAFEKRNEFLKAPELETNALGNDHGEGEIKIANAIRIKGLPDVNIHSYSFAAGNQELVLGKGVCLLLGFIDDDAPLKMHDAGLNDPSTSNIDWLFE